MESYFGQKQENALTLDLCDLSFWRHPFTAENPLVRKWSNTKIIQICSDQETNSSTSWPEGEYIFSKLIFLGELFLIYTSILLYSQNNNKDTTTETAKIFMD